MQSTQHNSGPTTIAGALHTLHVPAEAWQTRTVIGKQHIATVVHEQPFTVHMPFLCIFSTISWPANPPSISTTRWIVGANAVLPPLPFSIPWVISVRCRHMLPSTTQMARWLSHTAASNVVKASTRRWRRSSHIHWASHTKWSVSKHRITWLLLMDRWRPPQSPARPFVMWEKKLPYLFAWILFIIPIAGSKNRMRNHPHPYGTHSKHSAIGYSMANADASVL